MEITLKSALLYKDFDEYNPQLAQMIGHDLEKALKAYLNEYRIKIIDKRILSEISELNSFYKTHRLRYASLADLQINPKTIKSDNTIRFITRLIKVFDMKFMK